MTIQAIKGVKDILPEDIPAWRHLEATARKIFEDYGFAEIRVPVFEYTELFARSIGATTDIVEKEMYTFEDRDGRKITLRPEGTAGVVRSFIEHKMYADAQLTRLYYLGPMFRHERPQKGRYRQFHQIGVETLGIDHPHVDIEVLVMLHRLYEALGITGLTLQVNSLGDSACRGAYRDKLKEYLKDKLPTLCGDCQRRYETNPLRVLDCKVDAEKFGDSPVMLDHLCEPCKVHFETVEAGLKKLDIPFVINPRLVRGLDYYTRTTFDWSCGHGRAEYQAAGGRYEDGAEIGGRDGPHRLSPASSGRYRPDTSSLAAAADTVSCRARQRRAAWRCLSCMVEVAGPGETDYLGASLKSQMKKADKCGAGFTLIIGEQEITAGTAVLRNMQTKEQTP
jgi:histidyl-tRNA synthetase